MKILIVSSSFPPEDNPSSLRPYYWAKYWTLSGHDVTILTTEKKTTDTELLYLPNPGFKVIEVPLPFNLFELWMVPALKIIKAATSWDLVISTGRSFSNHIIANIVKRKGNVAHWITDLQGNQNLFNFLQKKVLKDVDFMTSTSHALAVNLKKTFKHDRVAVIENGYDPESLKTLSSSPIFIHDGKFRLLFTGSFNIKDRDPSPLFDAIKSINENPEMRHLLNKLEVIFAGSNLNTVSEITQRQAIDKWVKVIDSVSKEDTLRMQRDAHALLFLPYNSPSTGDDLSETIFNYLLSKTPIVSVGNNRLESEQLLILETNAGQSLLNTKEMIEYLIYHLNTVQKSHSQSNLECLKGYTKESLAHQLLNQVQSHVSA